MKRFFILSMTIFALALTSMAKQRTVKINIIHTSDVHGNCFPYNFIEQQPWNGSYARVSSFVKQQRDVYGKNLILLDNGDVLQGQPSAYYYNFMDTQSKHLFAEVLNYMKYDAGNIGNHDIETGHAVYDRWIKQCNFPIIGANTIDTRTEKPYLQPYIVFNRDGVKVAVLGMITPAIPAWLAENLWENMRFEDMVETARKWVPIIQQTEKPDLLIGMFHSGQDVNRGVTGFVENASLEVAKKVPGFDIVLFGHDHQLEYKTITNCAGKEVVIANPACNGVAASNIEVTFTFEGNNVVAKSINGKVEDMDGYQPDPQFLAHFHKQFQEVKEFVSKKIGENTTTISTRDAYFGSSAFIDFIHDVQMSIADADISFVAPLSFDAKIEKGDIHMSDMFNLMKYENMLYAMTLTGKEIKDYLEYSYYIWTVQMTSPDGHLLWLKDKPTKGDVSRASFQHESFNFDSAAGIIYTVDVTKPRGEKITIISMADGTPFDMNKTYRVAINSYRGNGGGALLTTGASIPKDELKNRIVFSTDKDLRYYMLQYITNQKVISPQAHNNWKFIPEELVKPAAERDRNALFNHRHE
ncbi:MAG: bifunctional metallophosphatase/5'-nucleotidase [Muribaculaceae bacterium]